MTIRYLSFSNLFLDIALESDVLSRTRRNQFKKKGGGLGTEVPNIL